MRQRSHRWKSGHRSGNPVKLFQYFQRPLGYSFDCEITKVISDFMDISKERDTPFGRRRRNKQS